MTRHFDYLWRMIALVAALLALAGWLGQSLISAFMASKVLDGAILVLLAAGISHVLFQTWCFCREISWFQEGRRARSFEAFDGRQRFLGSLAGLLASPETGGWIAHEKSDVLLSKVEQRLDESREVTRYLINLLILIGLAGTFWGLLKTLGGIGQVIGAMTLGDSELVAMFDALKNGLQGPLKGMGISFSTSLFGLAASMVLGALDLHQNQLHRRFSRELEEWLDRTSQPAPTAPGDDGRSPRNLDLRVIESVLNKLARNAEGLQDALKGHEEQRARERAALIDLCDKISLLNDRLQTGGKGVDKIFQSTADIHESLRSQLEIARGRQERLEEHVSTYLRGIDLSLRQILERIEAGKDGLTADLRQEIRMIGELLSNGGGAGHG